MLIIILIGTNIILYIRTIFLKKELILYYYIKVKVNGKSRPIKYVVINYIRLYEII